MSRAESFEAFYRDSRERLLHQVYAYAGITEVAERALAEAYVAAAQRWRSLAAEPDKDAWMRAQAFKATATAHKRSREPWYVSARRTADEHRPLLSALAALSPTDRHVAIAHHLAGLGPPAAAREAAVSESAAEAALRGLERSLRSAGVEVSAAGLATAFDGLRDDLPGERAGRSSRLRRHGDRRRRTRLLLAGAGVVALALGAATLTAAETADDPAVDTGATALVPGTPEPTAAAPTAAPQFSTADLSTRAAVTSLDRTPARWTLESTSADFGGLRTVDPCLTNSPTQPAAEHSWVRAFTTATQSPPSAATQTLEVMRTPQDAQAAYRTQLAAFAGCPAGGRRVIAVKEIHGIGDRAALVTLQYVVSEGVHHQRVAIARTGSAVTVWIVKAQGRPTSSRFLVRLLADSVDVACRDAAGACATRPYEATSVVPPPADSARGFLASVDLPLFAGLADAWVATPPVRASGNPAATACDRADFSSAGATTVLSRSYVVPGTDLPDTFGMSETVGTFDTRQDAKSFVGDVTAAVEACPDGQLGLAVVGTTDVATGRGPGVVWRIDLQTSQRTTLTFRVALVRVGSRVAQVTFTPGGGYDVGQRGYVALATRAAERLMQLS